MSVQTERLLLQVDAATELLRQHLTEAEPSLDRFERRAEKMATAVDRSIGRMGERFGAFAELADSAASQAQKSFEASFSQVQKLAASAIKGPTVDGRINLGADDIRAGAAAAQQEARAFALIGEAAERAALDIGDTSEATRLFIAATSASRIEAERKATALLAEAGALERVEIELRQSAEATDLFVGKHQRLAVARAEQDKLAVSAAHAATQEKALAAAADIVRAELDPMYLAQKRFNDELDRAEALLGAGILRQHEYDATVAQSRATLQAHAQAVAGSSSAGRQLVNSQGAIRAAMQGVSYQTQDLFTQLSMGANFFQVVAIQGGQLAGQFANIEGKAGSFARFMIGPWGLAITAGLLVLGPLTKGLLDFGNAEQDALDKLKQDAIESDVAAKAKARFAHSIDGVTQALKEQDKALKETASSERSSAERANIAAKAKRDEALAIRQKTASKLAEAEAELGDFSLTGATTGAAALQNQARSDRVAKLRKDRLAADAAVKEAERQLNVTRVDLGAEQAAISLDPVRAVTKLYDDRIKALKDQQREEARLGRQVGAESKARIEQLEKEKKAKVEAAQAAVTAANRKPSATADNQIGREIDIAEATRIAASIGGRVTSGLRSTERQAELYADKLAGRHKGPVAKPGTSDHERGQAIDIAYGPGVSAASIKAAFAKEGVAIRQLLNERDQKVFHVAFGKKGPSRETVENKAEAARVALINNEIAYNEQERAARQKLLAATRRGAETDQQREFAASESAQVERDTTREKIAGQLSAKKITAAQADQLTELNEATYTQQLQNLLVDRANRVLERRFDAEQDDLEARLAVLRIGEDLALTEADRRKVARDILDAEQDLRRKALERVRDTSQDPDAVLRAKRQLDTLPTLEAAEDRQFDARTAGPLDAYRARLTAATADMGTAIEESAVRGFGALEDAGARATASAVTNLLGLKGVAGDVIGSVIADLARLAIQKAVVSAIGGSFFGFADGGSLGDVPGFATGGSPGGQIRGPGNGRSDSILALLRGPGGGAVRLSNREFIMNEGAVDFYGADMMAAINARQLPRFATGGALSGRSVPNLGALRAPRLPDLTGSARRDRVEVTGDIRLQPTKEFDARMENLSFRAVGAAAEPIMAGAESRTRKRLARPSLPGAPG